MCAAVEAYSPDGVELMGRRRQLADLRVLQLLSPCRFSASVTLTPLYPLHGKVLWDMLVSCWTLQDTSGRTRACRALALFPVITSFFVFDHYLLVLLDVSYGQKREWVGAFDWAELYGVCLVWPSAWYSF